MTLKNSPGDKGNSSLVIIVFLARTFIADGLGQLLLKSDSDPTYVGSISHYQNFAEYGSIIIL